MHSFIYNHQGIHRVFISPGLVFFLVKRRRLESVEVSAAAAEREILMELFESTNGQNWKRGDNWGTGKPIRELKGVTVGTEGNVIGIDLGGNNLKGLLLCYCLFESTLTSML